MVILRRKQEQEFLKSREMEKRKNQGIRIIISGPLFENRLWI